MLFDITLYTNFVHNDNDDNDNNDSNNDNDNNNNNNDDDNNNNNEKEATAMGTFHQDKMLFISDEIKDCSLIVPEAQLKMWPKVAINTNPVGYDFVFKSLGPERAIICVATELSKADVDACIVCDNKDKQHHSKEQQSTEKEIWREEKSIFVMRRFKERICYDHQIAKAVKNSMQEGT